MKHGFFASDVLLLLPDGNVLNLFTEEIRKVVPSARILAATTIEDALPPAEDGDRASLPKLAIIDEASFPGSVAQLTERLGEIRFGSSVPIIALCNGCEAALPLYLAGARSALSRPQTDDEICQLVNTIANYWLRLNLVPEPTLSPQSPGQLAA